jgi:hypothetical protein
MAVGIGIPAIGVCYSILSHDAPSCTGGENRSVRIGHRRLPTIVDTPKAAYRQGNWMKWDLSAAGEFSQA